MITKAIDTAYISYQMMVVLLEGRHLQFFVHKKLDPPSLLCNIGLLMKWSIVLQYLCLTLFMSWCLSLLCN